MKRSPRSTDLRAIVNRQQKWEGQIDEANRFAMTGAVTGDTLVSHDSGTGHACCHGPFPKWVQARRHIIWSRRENTQNNKTRIKAPSIHEVFHS